jgi:hypothetical protein
VGRFLNRSRDRSQVVKERKIVSRDGQSMPVSLVEMYVVGFNGQSMPGKEDSQCLEKRRVTQNKKCVETKHKEKAWLERKGRLRVL